jgi:hypothetical protein
VTGQIDPDGVAEKAREAAQREAAREHEVAEALLRELGEK